jgi:RING finger/CHY zinc finger protein 1
MAVAVIGQQEGLTTPFLAEDFFAHWDQILCGGHDEICEITAHSYGNRSIKSANDEQHERESFGLLKYGCAHYKRRCKIRAPCCHEVFGCRHCHNEAKHKGPGKCPDLPLNGVESVICSVCSTEQEPHQICVSCGVKMGEYFCDKCRFFDDDTKKGQYHCDECGICRTGGRDKFFHCQRCGCCLSVLLQKGHPCVEKSMHQNCPVCLEYLFDSSKGIEVLKCGHTMHVDCLDDMRKHSQFACPICSKSTCDMTKYWEKIDEEVAKSPMPHGYQKRVVWILCNDCGTTGTAYFHFIGQKCGNCRSYNTRQIRP